MNIEKPKCRLVRQNGNHVVKSIHRCKDLKRIENFEGILQFVNMNTVINIIPFVGMWSILYCHLQKKKKRTHFSAENLWVINYVKHQTNQGKLMWIEIFTVCTSITVLWDYGDYKSKKTSEEQEANPTTNRETVYFSRKRNILFYYT